MCQYSCVDGMPTDWHLVHLGALAVGGAALVFTEATAVTPEGRISPADTGIWNDEQADVFARIVRFVRGQGAVAGMQLAHAGRKASRRPPWEGGGLVSPEEGGWEPVAPSAVPYDEGWVTPHALSEEEIAGVVEAFVAAAQRAEAAGFDVVELHMAHGYLLHEFLSPLSNRRDDRYGGSLENRMRAPLEVTRAVRAAWPEAKPLFVRISATDWVEGGWDVEDSVVFARELKDAGVELVDCSSGGNSPHAADRRCVRLSGSVRRGGSPRGGHRDRRGRADHRAGAGGSDRGGRRGGRRPARARIAARPALAAARGARARRRHPLAGAVRACEDTTLMEFLHTCYRITDIDRSVAFYEALGFEERRRMPIREEAINVFMGLPGDTDKLELTYNFGVDSYDLGTAYGHIAVGVDDLAATLGRLKEQGIEPEREPYRVREGGSLLCFVRDPDGYRIEIIGRGPK